jgi:putative two-component system protein, hydrogenase maturation factor HypX/HoxX
MEAAVRDHDPELIICPFLKTMIPESIWRTCRCLVVHPGPCGDRGPSSLDWAIELGMSEWGVTVLLANGEFDAGEVVAARSFRMRDAGKASLYRHEVRHAAIEAMLEALRRMFEGPGRDDPRVQAIPIGRARPVMTQDDRAIDWGYAFRGLAGESPGLRAVSGSGGER